MAEGHRAAARTSWGDVRVNMACSYAKFGADSTWHKRHYTWGLDLSGSLQGAGGVGGLLALNGWYYPGNSGTAKWISCYDGNGNVTQLLGTSGTHVILGAHYEYDAFGQITAAPNPWAYWTNIAWSNPFRFSTKFLSAWNRRGYEYNIAWHNMDYYWLRWYDYGYRWYDPMKGRWTSRDAIGEFDGPNVHAFVHNTPLNLVDRNGRESWGIYHDKYGNWAYPHGLPKPQTPNPSPPPPEPAPKAGDNPKPDGDNSADHPPAGPDPNSEDTDSGSIWDDPNLAVEDSIWHTKPDPPTLDPKTFDPEDMALDDITCEYHCVLNLRFSYIAGDGKCAYDCTLKQGQNRKCKGTTSTDRPGTPGTLEDGTDCLHCPPEITIKFGLQP